MRRAVVFAVIGVGLLVGCKGTVPAPEGAGGGSASGAAVKVKQVAPLDPATLGEVSGVVKLVGKAPEPVRIDTTMDPACGIGATGDTYSEQYAVKDGKLANVYIYVKSGPAVAMAQGASGAPAVVLDQKGCSYVPHVVAVMAGGSVEFRNEDSTMHNVHTMPTVVGNAAVDISEGPKGKPQAKDFKAAELMIPVRCNNHPWMNAFINVSATPWFAVTGADGRFDLKGMPAGDYVLGAVQEKLGEQDVPVTVKAQGEAKADFAFAMK
jgi:plastocyanin